MKIKNWIFKNSLWLIWLIIILAVFLRVWKLGSIPPSLTPDEASLGYNAYSILKTAKDEYGQFLPIIYKSFGDYKPGIYVYLTVPFVKILGLNEFAVRLPSVISGVITIWLIYKIIVSRQWFVDKKKLSINRKMLATVSAFILAVNPWHIHFSRGAWEVNVALALTLAGIYFFLKSLTKNKNLILSSIFFALTFLTYQGAKLSTAIVLFVLTIVYWKECWGLIKENKKIVWQSLLVGLLIVLPIVVSLFSGKIGRLNVFSVFSYPRPTDCLQDFLDEGNEKIGSLSYFLYHSETLNFIRGIMGRWFNHFSGKFLFFEGDWANPRHSSPNSGMMLLSDLIFIVFGIFVALRSKTKLTKFTLLWLILSPFPAALSRDQVHAVRAFNMLTPLVILSSFGVVYLIEFSNKQRKAITKFFYFGSLAIMFFGSLIYYLDSYFIHLPKHDSKYWMYGYKQIVEEVLPLQDKYKTIKVQQSFSQPYIYFLFYSSQINPQRFNPTKYQESAELTNSEYKGDVGYINNIDNIKFAAIDFPQDKKDSGTLVVADNIRIPAKELENKNVNLIKEIRFLDGDVAFRIVEII